MAAGRLAEGTRLVIVVDQFEELVSAAPDVAQELDALLGALTRRWPDGTRRVQAVVVSRIDFLQQLEAFPHITEAWKTTNVVVPPMTREQLRETITRPLSDLKGIRFAAGLPEQILHDTPAGPSALPILEYALTELWKRQERGIITTEAYRDIGGVEGALARSAERALWQRVDESERLDVERVLIQMVRPGEQLDAGGRAPDTRRVASHDEFGDREWRLIHRLASTRLVTITRQPTGPDTAELAHEALLGAWPRLGGWVDANRAFRTWQEELRRSMRQWRDHEQDARFLATLDQDVRASRAPDNEVQLWDVASPENPAAAAAVDVPDVFSASVAVSADGRLLAVTGTLIGSSSQTVLWNIASPRNPVALSRLKGPTGSVAMARQGRRQLLAVAGEGAVALWDVTDPARPSFLGQAVISHPGNPEGDITVALSPDGEVLAALGTGDRVIRLWSLKDLGHVTTMRDLPNAPQGPLSLGDGGRILTDKAGGAQFGEASHTLLWMLAGPQGPRQITHLASAVGGAVTSAVDPVAPILATVTPSPRLNGISSYRASPTGRRARPPADPRPAPRAPPA